MEPTDEAGEGSIALLDSLEHQTEVEQGPSLGAAAADAEAHGLGQTAETAAAAGPSVDDADDESIGGASVIEHSSEDGQEEASGGLGFGRVEELNPSGPSYNELASGISHAESGLVSLGLGDGSDQGSEELEEPTPSVPEPAAMAAMAKLLSSSQVDLRGHVQMGEPALHGKRASTRACTHLAGLAFQPLSTPPFLYSVTLRSWAQQQRSSSCCKPGQHRRCR